MHNDGDTHFCPSSNSLDHDPGLELNRVGHYSAVGPPTLFQRPTGARARAIPASVKNNPSRRACFARKRLRAAN
jgi:hypothetical protein